MNHWLLKQTTAIKERFFFLNRLIVPFLFIYFLLMILPSLLPQLTFLPNIFLNSFFAVAYKGLVFFGFLLFSFLLAIVNGTKTDWRFMGPILFLGLLTTGVIFLTPSSFSFTAVSEDNLSSVLTADVSLGNRLSAFGECWANLLTAYAFLVIYPKAFYFRKQLSQLAFLFLLFVLASYLYSLVFEFQSHLASLFDLDPSIVIQGFFDHKNTFGKYLLLGVFLAVFLHHENKKRSYLFLIPVFLFGMFTIRSRTSLAIAAMFLFGSALFQVASDWKKVRKRAIVETSIAGAAVALVLSFF